jgi:hypothetical protein
MQIDFTPLSGGAVTPLDFAKNFGLNDLRATINTYLDTVRALVLDFDDAQLTFEPNDPKAKDDYAQTPDEVNMGWSLAHLVLHVTASLEEGAAISSLLARGVPVEGRFRYEPGWRDVTTRQQVLARIEESRRMCLAYLETWPDEPHLDVYRKFAPTSRFANVPHNAPAAFLSSLSHFSGHLDQLREVARQARGTVQTASLG